MSGIFARRAIALVRGARLSSGSADGGYGGSVKLWRNLTFFVAFPAIAVCMVNVYLDEDHGRPEFIKYDYLRIRGKRFPWGDGNKSLFHNPHTNALPEGYEDDGHH